MLYIDFPSVFQVIQIILEFKTIVDISDGPEDDAIIDYETLFCMNRIR